MANVYIETRPKGRPEGSHIDDYVVEDHADHILATFKTQREGIDWAKRENHHPLVARVRHVNDKKNPIIGARLFDGRDYQLPSAIRTYAADRVANLDPTFRRAGLSAARRQKLGGSPELDGMMPEFI